MTGVFFLTFNWIYQSASFERSGYAISPKHPPLRNSVIRIVVSTWVYCILKSKMIVWWMCRKHGSINKPTEGWGVMFFLHAENAFEYQIGFTILLIQSSHVLIRVERLFVNIFLHVVNTLVFRIGCEGRWCKLVLMGLRGIFMIKQLVSLITQRRVWVSGKLVKDTAESINRKDGKRREVSHHISCCIHMWRNAVESLIVLHVNNNRRTTRNGRDKNGLRWWWEKP
jgi:hypothetical protein